jgi:hypothetical protein
MRSIRGTRNTAGQAMRRYIEGEIVITASESIPLRPSPDESQRLAKPSHERARPLRRPNAQHHHETGADDLADLLTLIGHREVARLTEQIFEMIGPPGAQCDVIRFQRVARGHLGGPIASVLGLPISFRKRKLKPGGGQRDLALRMCPQLAVAIRAPNAENGPGRASIHSLKDW